MATRRDMTIRKSTLAAQGTENDLVNLTAAERIGLIEQLTIDCYAMRGEDIAEQRLQRHVVHLKTTRELIVSSMPLG